MRSDNLKYRKLTSTGDYSFGSGGNDYADGNEAVAQAIKTKLLLFYGEWWENLGEGIPMFQSVLGQTNPETIKSSLSMLVEQRIVEIQEVDSVKNIEIDYDRKNRTISMEVDVTTTSGEIVNVEVSF